MTVAPLSADAGERETAWPLAALAAPPEIGASM